MKSLVVFSALVVLSLATTASSNSAEKTAIGKSHDAVGTVKKVDPTAGTVTLEHGPVKSLNWPAMTMKFLVKDRAVLGKLSQDKKVEFEFVQQGSDYVITSVK